MDCCSNVRKGTQLSNSTHLARNGVNGEWTGWTVAAMLERAPNGLTAPTLPEHTRGVDLDEQPKSQATLPK